MANKEETDSLQTRVKPWLLYCFGDAIASDRLERSDRFVEEALELVQSGDYPKSRAYALVDYVYNRPKGEPRQEVGGVMITLASYCIAHGLDMHEAGDLELARIWTKVDAIREKQKLKPTGSALPVVTDTPSYSITGLTKLAYEVGAVNNTPNFKIGSCRNHLGVDCPCQEPRLEFSAYQLAEFSDRLLDISGAVRAETKVSMDSTTHVNKAYSEYCESKLASGATERQLMSRQDWHYCWNLAIASN